MNDDLLSAFYSLSSIEIHVYHQQERLDHQRHREFNPIITMPALRAEINQKLMDDPLLYQDAYHVFYIALKEQKNYYYAGPFTMRPLNSLELHHFYHDYHHTSHNEEKIPCLSLAKVLSLMQLLAKLINHRDYTAKELQSCNPLGLSFQKEDQIRFQINEEEEELYHHTYEEEKRLLDCVRNGQVEEAIVLNMKMDEHLGSMSKDDMKQCQKNVIVGITLSTRAAIEGGLTPASAYQLSDYYLQKSDQCQSIAQLLTLRNQAVEDLTKRVKEKSEKIYHSSYVEACCDYIEKHYREKIYLDDLAEKLGISASYLSRLFSSQKGERLQDYIVRVRVERAANLLKFSDESIARIGDYVNFPSQSYFGRVFKKIMHMTPREYRERYKPKEFPEYNLDDKK